MIGTCSFLLIMDGLSGIFNKMKQSMVEKIPESRTPTDPSKSSPKHEDYPYLPKELFASQPTGDRPSKPNPHNPTPPRIYYPEPRVPNYDGKFDFMDFQAQFECLAEDYEWSYEEMGSQLCRCLTGEARSVLSMLDRPSRRDYLALCEALKGLHTTPGSEAVWRLELHRTVRAAGQDPNKFGRELRRLAMRAYPDGDLPELALVTIFIQGLGDSAIGKHVFLKEPQTLQEAIRHACMFEAYNRSTRGSRAVNAVKVTPPISGDEQPGPIEAAAPREDCVRDVHLSADSVHPETPPSPSPENLPLGNCVGDSGCDVYQRSVEQVQMAGGDACLYLPASVQGNKIEWLMDCGANPNLLSAQAYQRLPHPPPLQPVLTKLVAANGDNIPAHGQTIVTLEIDGTRFQVPVIVADITSAAGILGMKFLLENECTVSFREGLLTCGQQVWELIGPSSGNCSQVGAIQAASASQQREVRFCSSSHVPESPAHDNSSLNSTQPANTCRPVPRAKATGGLMHIGPLTVEVSRIRSAQQEDPTIRFLLPWVSKSMKPPRQVVRKGSHDFQRLCALWSTLVVEDGLLFRRWDSRHQGSVLQLVVPPALRSEICRQVHCNGQRHVGIRRTVRMIRAKFFWPQVRSDVEHWRRKCVACAQHDSRPVQRGEHRLQDHGKGVGAQVSCARTQNIPATLIA